MNARKNTDDVRVADMLEYEIIPRLPQWTFPIQNLFSFARSIQLYEDHEMEE